MVNSTFVLNSRYYCNICQKFLWFNEIQKPSDKRGIFQRKLLYRDTTVNIKFTFSKND